MGPRADHTACDAVSPTCEPVRIAPCGNFRRTWEAASTPAQRRFSCRYNQTKAVMSSGYSSPFLSNTPRASGAGPWQLRGSQVAPSGHRRLRATVAPPTVRRCGGGLHGAGGRALDRIPVPPVTGDAPSLAAGPQRMRLGPPRHVTPPPPPEAGQRQIREVDVGLVQRDRLLRVWAPGSSTPCPRILRPFPKRVGVRVCGADLDSEGRDRYQDHKVPAELLLRPARGHAKGTRGRADRRQPQRMGPRFAPRLRRVAKRGVRLDGLDRLRRR